MELFKGQSVIVMDTSNYIDEYSNDDPVPFKATVHAIYDNNEVVVTSDESGKKYSIYTYQILECFNDAAIKQMVNVKAWYEDGGKEFLLDRLENNEETK